MVKVRCPKCGTIFPPEAREVQICPNCGCVMRVTRRAAARRYISDRRDEQYYARDEHYGDGYRLPQSARLPERSGVYLSREEYEDLLYKARSRRDPRDDRGYYREGYADDYTGYGPAYDTPREVYDYRLAGRDYPAYRRPEPAPEPEKETPFRPEPSVRAEAETPAPEPVKDEPAPVTPAPEQEETPAPASASSFEPSASSPFAPLPAPEPEKTPAPEQEKEPAAPVVSSYSPFARSSAVRPFGSSAYDRPETSDTFRPAPASVQRSAPVAAPARKTRYYSLPATALAAIVALVAGVMNGLLLVLAMTGTSLFEGTTAFDLIDVYAKTELIAETIITIAVIALPVLAALFGLIGALAHKKALMIVMGILLIVAAAATVLYPTLVQLPSVGFDKFAELIKDNFKALTLWTYIAGGLSLLSAIFLFACAGTTKKKA